MTGIANAMITVAALPAAEWMRLSMGAIARANELSWARLTEDIASCHKLERSNAAIIQ